MGHERNSAKTFDSYLVACRLAVFQNLGVNQIHITSLPGLTYSELVPIKHTLFHQIPFSVFTCTVWFSFLASYALVLLIHVKVTG